MPKTWVVVAESSRAKIFTVDNPRGPLRELESLDHPESRAAGQDLASDRPGRAFDRAGEGRHAMGQPVDPREQEVIRFAKQLAERLEAGRVNGDVERIYLIAAPQFLGELRQNLANGTAQLVVQEIDKNLVRHDPADIRSHLPERL